MCVLFYRSRWRPLAIGRVMSIKIWSRVSRKSYHLVLGVYVECIVHVAVHSYPEFIGGQSQGQNICQSFLVEIALSEFRDVTFFGNSKSTSIGGNVNVDSRGYVADQVLFTTEMNTRCTVEYKYAMHTVLVWSKFCLHWVGTLVPQQCCCGSLVVFILLYCSTPIYTQTWLRPMTGSVASVLRLTSLVLQSCTTAGNHLPVTIPNCSESRIVM